MESLLRLEIRFIWASASLLVSLSGLACARLAESESSSAYVCGERPRVPLVLLPTQLESLKTEE